MISAFSLSTDLTIKVESRIPDHFAVHVPANALSSLRTSGPGLSDAGVVRQWDLRLSYEGARNQGRSDECCDDSVHVFARRTKGPSFSLQGKDRGMGAARQYTLRLAAVLSDIDRRNRSPLRRMGDHRSRRATAGDGLLQIR